MQKIKGVVQFNVHTYSVTVIQLPRVVNISRLLIGFQSFFSLSNYINSYGKVKYQSFQLWGHLCVHVRLSHQARNCVSQKKGEKNLMHPEVCSSTCPPMEGFKIKKLLISCVSLFAIFIRELLRTILYLYKHGNKL